MLKEVAQWEADLPLNHLVHCRKGGNQHNFPNLVSGGKLQRRRAPERMSKHANGFGIPMPSLLLQKSLQRLFRVLQDRLWVRPSFTDFVSRVIDEQIPGLGDRERADQLLPG